MSDILNVELYENIISYDILFADNPLLKLGQVVHVADLPWSKDAPMKMGIDELFNNTPYRGTVELIVNTNVEEKIVDTTPYEIVGTRVSIYNSGSSYNKVIFDTIDIFDRQEITMLYTIDGWQQVTMPAAVGSTLNNYIDDGNFDSGIAPKWTFNAGEINLSLETLQPLTGLYSLLVFKELGNQQTKKVTYPFTIYEADKNKILNFKCIFKPDTDYLNAYRIKIIDNETNIIADELLEAQQLPISDFSFLFTTNDNTNYTLVIECDTDNTDSFDYVFDNFYVGEVLSATTTDTESQPVGTMIPYAGTIDSLDEANGWLFADYRAVSQTTYADLFSKIGYRFSVDAADVSTMITNGTFRIPNGKGKVPRGAFNAVIQSIDTGTDVITLAEQVFVRNGTPVKFYTNGGTLPTIGGSPVDEATVYFVGVISGATIKLYDTEANAIAGGATGLINFDGNVSGTVILSSCGVYEEDAMQGHWHDQYYFGLVIALGTNANAIALSGGTNNTKSTPNDSVRSPITDGANGTPRTSNVTRDTSFSANWIIRWKQQATATFFKQTSTLKDAGKVYIDTQKPSVTGLNNRGDIVLSGQHVYLISNYPDLFNAGIPISDLILPCDGTGDTNSPDGIHFTTYDMSMQFVRGAIYGHLLSTAWDVTTADDVDLGRSDIPNGTPIYFDVSPCTGVDAGTVYYLGLRTGTRYVLYDTEANANTNNNSTGKIALSGTAFDSNYYSVSLEQLDALQGHHHQTYYNNSLTQADETGVGGALMGGDATTPLAPSGPTADHVQAPSTDPINGTPRTSNETRPTNVQVFYYITAKNTPIIVYAPMNYANDFIIKEDLTVVGNSEIQGNLTLTGALLRPYELMKSDFFITAGTSGKIDGDAYLTILSSASISTEESLLNEKHQGIIKVIGSGNIYSGAVFSFMSIGQYKLQGEEKYKCIFRTGPGVATRVIRVGIYDSVDASIPDNGIYIIVSDGAGAVAVKIAGSVEFSEEGIATFSADTWYRIEIDVKEDLSGFLYRIYTNDDNGLIVQDDITCALPTKGLAARASFIVTTTATLVIGYMDYMSFKYPNVIGRD